MSRAKFHSSAAEYLTYVAFVGAQADSFEIRYEDENIWLTQKMMAALYSVSVSAINQHLKKIFEDGELLEDAVIKKYLITASDGKTYCTKHYNLQAIIAVGFKVNNEPASTKFWTIEKRMKQDKKTPGVCIELNKGNIIFDLVCFFQDEVITFDDFDDFSEELRENVKLLLERFGKYE